MRHIYPHQQSPIVQVSSTSFGPRKRTSILAQLPRYLTQETQLPSSSTCLQTMSSLLHSNIIPEMSPERPPSARKRGGTQFEIQAALIPQQNRFQYRSPAALVRTITSTIDSNAAEEYFIYIQGIGEKDPDKIQTRLGRSFFFSPFTRLAFENALGAAIIRITPTSERGSVGASLSQRIMAKISFAPPSAGGAMNCSRVSRGDIPGVRSKQGEYALVPATRGNKDDWPAVVIGVGCPQGLDFYRSDAKWWLINSAGLTRFVIIVQLIRNPPALHFECWKMIRSGRRQTRQTRAWIPSCVQDCDIDEKGVVVSASSELRIPYGCIFDEPPDNASDVVLTNAELSHLALFIFSKLPRNR